MTLERYNPMAITAKDGGKVIGIDLEHPAMGVPALSAEMMKRLSGALQ
jgi:hypothetical protein